MRRPSEYRPAGLLKKDWPLGGTDQENAAEIAPVSELESPKLKMAGQSQVCKAKVGFRKRTQNKEKADRLVLREFMLQDYDGLV